MADKYVSPYGDNGGAGTLLDPWLTISHALATVSSGDTINLRAGSYNELGAVLTFSVANLTVQAHGSEPVKVYTRGFDVTAAGVTLKDLAFTWDRDAHDASLLRAPFGRVLANNCTLEHFIVDQQYADPGGIEVGDVSTNVTGFVANRVWLREFTSPTNVTFGFRLVNATGARITNYIADLIDGAAIQIEPLSSGTFIAYVSFCNVRYFVNLRGDASHATHDNAIYNSGGDAYDSTYNLDWGTFGPGTGNVADVTFTDGETAINGTGGFTATNTNTAWMQFVNVSGEPADYHLLSASPGRGAATDRGVAEDFDGQPRSGTFDVGALQYTSADYFAAALSPRAPDGDNRRLGLYETTVFDPDSSFDPFSPQREVTGFLNRDYTLAPGETLAGALHVGDGAAPSIPDASVTGSRFYNPSHPSAGYDFADPVVAILDGSVSAGFYAEGDYTQTYPAQVTIGVYLANADGTTTVIAKGDTVTIPPGAPRAFYSTQMAGYPTAAGNQTLEPGAYLLSVTAAGGVHEGAVTVFGLEAPVQWATNPKQVDVSGYVGSGGTGGVVSLDTTSFGSDFIRYDATVSAVGEHIYLESAPVSVYVEEPERQLLSFVQSANRLTLNLANPVQIGMRFYDGSMTLLDEQYIASNVVETFPPSGTVFTSFVVRGTATAAGPAAIAFQKIVFGVQEAVANLLAFLGDIGATVEHYVDGDNAEMVWRGAADASRSVGGLIASETGAVLPPLTLESADTLREITWDGTGGGRLTRPAVYFDALPAPLPPPPPGRDGLETVCFTTIDDRAIIDDDPTSTTSVYTFTVSDARPVEFIDVSWWFEHTFSGDVKITLTAPDSTSVDVAIGNDINYGAGDHSGMGTGTGTGQQCHVADDAAGGLHLADDTTGNWTGDFLPDNPLAPLYGQPGTGVWTLAFEDISGGDSGTVHLARVCLSFPEGLAETPWAPPKEEDMYYGRLPFHEAQRIFTLTGPEPPSINANCGWYHTRYDPEWGSFGIVRSDGPLAGLVGERVLVTYSSAETSETRSVVVYVHDEGDMVEDIAISRRAFLALSTLAAGKINVFCQAMSEDRT